MLKVPRFLRLTALPVAIILLMAIAGCGGGGSSPAPTATLSGQAQFPAAAGGTSKVVANMIPATGITVKVYDLNGKEAGTVAPSDLLMDSDPTKNIYSYKVTGLPPGADYVVKVTRGNQVLKKLVEKKDVAAGSTVQGNLDITTTTAVAIAEKILNVPSLGDAPLPTGTSLATISSSIAASVQPALLETKISGLVNNAANDLSTITSQDEANIINIYSIVQAAVSNGITAESVVADPTQLPTTVTVPQITVTDTVTTSQNVSSGNLVIPTVNYTPPTNGELASTYIVAAKAYLAKQDIANASYNFEAALTLDPANKDANFGSGITKGIMLIENADVKAIIEKWGVVAPTVNQVISAASPVGNPFTNISSVATSVPANPLAKTTAKTSAKPATTNSMQLSLSTLNSLKGLLPQPKQTTKTTAKITGLVPATAPSVTEMQTVIDNVIIPAVKTINERLAKVEGTGYTFTVTKAMQGNTYGTDVVLDDGEFYTLDAALNGILTILKISTAYNFDVANNDYNSISRDPLATLNGTLNGTTFFTLKADGRTKMADALTFVKAARDKAEAAYNVVKLRAVGQGAFDITGWSTVTRTDFENVLATAKSVLAGQASVTIGNKPVTIDATKFFTNPLDRSKLPTLGYDVQPDATLSLTYNKPVAGEQTVPWYVGWDYNTNQPIYQSVVQPISSDIVPKSDLPDYTLNGILPNNSAFNNVAGFNGILPVLNGKLLTGATATADSYYNISTDGTYIYAITGAYSGSSSATTIKRIDPASGSVSDFGTMAGWADRLVWYGGSLYAFQSNSTYDQTTGTSTNSLGLYKVDTTATPWSISTTPVFQKNAGSSYPYVSGAAVNGTDIYYAINAWDQTTFTDTSSVYKLSTLTSEATIFTTQDYVNSMTFSNGFLYTSGQGFFVKRSATDGSIVASYVTAGGGETIAVGGYFYSVNNAKLVKFAGTPAGGTAKLTSLLGKFF
jgi:hypothetical protein